MRRLIIFLIRKRLRLRKYQRFRFKNQKSPTDCYFFTSRHLMKQSAGGYMYGSHVSLNWLLSDDCAIIRDVTGGNHDEAV